MFFRESVKTARKSVLNRSLERFFPVVLISVKKCVLKSLVLWKNGEIAGFVCQGSAFLNLEK